MAQQSRVTGVATTISQIEGYTTITYHHTPVVQFNEKTIILRSGGWRSSTTKTRMNQASSQFDLGFSVHQKDFDWFVIYKGKTQEYQDHMILDRRNGG